MVGDYCGTLYSVLQLLSSNSCSCQETKFSEVFQFFKNLIVFVFPLIWNFLPRGGG